MNNVQSIARATLNIGHDVPAHNAEAVGNDFTWESATVLAVIKELGIEVIESACHRSNTEDTTVVAIAEPLTPSQGEWLAVVLYQDAIVQYVHGNTGASALYGPKAAEWGPFNPELFVTLDGGTLAAE